VFDIHDNSFIIDVSLASSDIAEMRGRIYSKLIAHAENPIVAVTEQHELYIRAQSFLSERRILLNLYSDKR
jgi:hypothetical protein